MPVIIGEIDGLPLNFILFVGKVSRKEALQLPVRIAARDPKMGARWINIIDPEADMSDLDADCLLAVKELLTPVIQKLKGQGPFRAVLVSQSKYNDPLANVWRTLTTTDPDYPSNPLTSSTIGEACLLHGLCAADAMSAERWLRRELIAARGT